MQEKEKIQINSRRELNKKRYLVVFLLTLTIFITGILLSTGLNKQRVVDVEKIEDTMSIDILSSEIQFALLKESGCEGVTEKTTLSGELKELASKLTFMETNIKDKSEEFINLKKRYTLLQIKDILLMKEMSEKCDLNPINILYFYSNQKDKCNDCKKQGYVLTKLSKDNPRLRVYAFDYDLDLGALKTLIHVKGVSEKKLPVLVINNEVHSGFQGVDDIQKVLPKLEIKEEVFDLFNPGNCIEAHSQCNDCNRSSADDVFVCTEAFCTEEEFTCDKWED